jgi:hypothetical protein
MRMHPTDPKLYLVEPADLRADPLPELVRQDYELLAEAMGWAVSYLTNPHPELGRSGAVCPFTRPALRKNTFFLTVYHGSDLRREDVVEVVRAYRDWFLELEPTEGKDVSYKTINILFPDISTEAAIELIEDTQTALKPEYVPYGIMIGEFHPGPPRKAGLWNPEFRPLKSPMPLMSIRFMVPTDFAFLRDTPDLMTAYLERFADRVPGPMRADVEATAREFGLEHLLAPADPIQVVPSEAAPIRVVPGDAAPLRVVPAAEPALAAGAAGGGSRPLPLAE